MKQYTRQEIDSAINTLTSKEESLLLDRKDINKNIKSVRDNIKFYLELDESQLKMF
tara:strand:- start:95 stop:262 length:168 start_codon:yes stop_codon:yes gene_type:complete